MPHPGQAISSSELMNMVQLWKMLVSEQPVRKRYLQKQGSILSRGRRAVSAVTARVAEAGPALSHVEGAC